MADLEGNTSPGHHDDPGQLGLSQDAAQDYSSLAALDSQPRGVKRARPSAADDDDDDEDGKAGRERRKIDIKFIQDKSRRHITFSKRKAGIMKKAYELSVLTGTQVLLLVVSETGLVYTFTTPKLQPLVTQTEGKNLIQKCLNANEGGAGDGGDDGSQVDSPEDSGHPVMAPQSSMANSSLPLHPNYMTSEQQAAVAANAAYQYGQPQQQQVPHMGQQSHYPRATIAQGHPAAQLKH